jgi:hypothetical protein
MNRLAFLDRKLIFLAIGYLLLTIGYAQSLTFGLYGRGPDYITPTIEASLSFNDLTLGLQAQRDGVGVLIEQALELGPVGRLSFGARGNLGFANLYTGTGSLQWGGEVFARGGAGPVALETRLAYATVARNLLWVGDTQGISDTAIPFGVLSGAGFSAALAGRYRLDRNQTLALAVGYDGNWLAEGSFALRKGATYTFGAGYQGGIYGLLGWKGELDEEGALLDMVLRAGQFNQLSAALFLENLKLRLTLAYPLTATVGLEVNALRLDGTYNPNTGAWSAWLRYTIVFAEE